MELGSKQARRFRLFWPILVLATVGVGSASILAWVPTAAWEPGTPPTINQQLWKRTPPAHWSPYSVEIILTPGETASRSFTISALTVKQMASRGASPLTRAEFESLAMRGELVARRVDIRIPSDIERIAITGATLWTQEPLYVIVAGDAARVNAVAALGFQLSNPAEADYKLRYFRTNVSDRDRYEHLRTIVSDAFPASIFPASVLGRAYDYQLKWMREAGFIVDVCPSLSACERP